MFEFRIAHPGVENSKADEMISRRAFAKVLLGGTAIALVGCSQIHDSESLRYRLIVEVDTPDGVKSGYSVWEYTLAYSILNDVDGLSSRYRGAAVAVDLPNGKTLFALLSFEDGSPEYPKHVIWAELPHSVDGKKVFETFAGWRGINVSWVVPRRKEIRCVAGEKNCDDGNYPMLVTFSDIKDPKTIAKVDPDNLEASFGEGYKLKAVSVQTTREPVTTGIDKRLPWLPKAYEILRGTDFKPAGIPVGDFRGLFSTELR